MRAGATWPSARARAAATSGAPPPSASQSSSSTGAIVAARIASTQRFACIGPIAQMPAVHCRACLVIRRTCTLRSRSGGFCTRSAKYAGGLCLRLLSEEGEPEEGEPASPIRPMTCKAAKLHKGCISAGCVSSLCQVLVPAGILSEPGAAADGAHRPQRGAEAAQAGRSGASQASSASVGVQSRKIAQHASCTSCASTG